MKVRRKVALGLGIILFGAILGACGSNEAEGDTAKGVALNTKSQFPIVEEGEELELSIMAPGMGRAEWKDMPVLKDYQEKTGIKMSYVTPPSADFATKLNLAFAADDLTDIIYGAGSGSLTPSMELDYGAQGTLMALEDYITPELMPNLSKLIEEDPTIIKSITTPDGHVYSLPMIARNGSSVLYQSPLWYNGEWLDALGVTELPKTTDEFYDLLVRFRDEDPNGNGKKDEIPMTDLEMYYSRVWLMSAFGLKLRGIQEVDGVVSYTPISENYKEFLAYMNKLYSEGLLDKEVYSQSEDQKKAKGQNNQVGLFGDYYSFFTTGRTEKEAMSDPMFHPLSSEFTDRVVVPANSRLNRGAFAITKNNPSIEASVRWVDYFYSAEGARYLEQGPEGVMWETVQNKAGEDVRVFLPEVDLDDTETFRSKITPAYGLITPNIVVDQELVRKDPETPGDVAFRDWVTSEAVEKYEPVAEVPFPLLYLTREENDIIAINATDLKTYVEEMEAKFITGVASLDEWDKYVETIESMGIEEYVAIHQQAYDRWKMTE